MVNFLPLVAFVVYSYITLEPLRNISVSVLISVLLLLFPISLVPVVVRSFYLLTMLIGEHSHCLASSVTIVTLLLLFSLKV